EFEAIDSIATGFEGLSPMRTTHRHPNAHFADFQMAQAMNDHHLTSRPAVAGFALDFRHLFLGHAGIGFIVERRRRPTIRQVANRSQESDDAATIRPAYLLRQLET